MACGACCIPKHFTNAFNLIMMFEHLKAELRIAFAAPDDTYVLLTANEVIARNRRIDPQELSQPNLALDPPPPSA